MNLTITYNRTFSDFIDLVLKLVTYKPVSRILAGGFSNNRTVETAVLGWDLLWDSSDSIMWDDDTFIGGE